MRRISWMLALAVVCVGRPLRAQAKDYVPSQELPEGPELIAVYVGATDCGPCRFPAVKKAVREMKPLLAAQAKKRGMAFTVIGAAQDWDIRQGAAFLDSLGAFDQVVIGGNWTNLATEQVILRDSLAELAMPQIVVLQRTVRLGQRVTVSPPHVIRRIVGGADIPAWVAAGAPVTIPEDNKEP